MGLVIGIFLKWYHTKYFYIRFYLQHSITITHAWPDFELSSD